MGIDFEMVLGDRLDRNIGQLFRSGEVQASAFGSEKIEELVAVVNRRMVEIRTELSSHEIVSQHERDMDHLEIIDQLKVCLAAYEQTLKNKYAGRIRPQIAENGFIDTVDSLVQKRTRSDGFIKLRDLGLEEFLFEQVIVENPEAFSEDAVAMSKERLCVQC